MGEYKYLTIKLADSLANSTGLRNRLAYEYDEVDQKNVYKAVKRCLDEVPRYMKRVIRLV